MTFPIHELAALATAMCWALTSVLAAAPAGHLGAVAFSRLRQTSVALLLAVFVFASGRWQPLSLHEITLLVASGVIGIFIGDSLLFTSLNRLGPRKSSIIFALNAPFTAVMGFVFLGESLSLMAMAGIGLCVGGVMLAVFYGRRADSSHEKQLPRPVLLIGVALGLAAALSQAAGSIFMRPLMTAGFDPFVASMLRVALAGACLSVLLIFPIASIQQKNAMTLKVAGQTILTGILAMGVGATLLMFAFSGSKTGIISTLSATSPAMVLPMLWFITKQRPAVGAWVGAGLVVVGMALLFAGR